MPPSERPRPLSAAEVAYLGFSARWSSAERNFFDVWCDGTYVGRWNAAYLTPGFTGLRVPLPELPEGVVWQLAMKLREQG